MGTDLIFIVKTPCDQLYNISVMTKIFPLDVRTVLVDTKTQKRDFIPIGIPKNAKTKFYTNW